MPTPIVHAPRATLPAIGKAILGTSPKRPWDVAEFISEVYRIAVKVGYDPLALIGQCSFETAVNGVPFASDLWNQYLNPAGIGQTDGGAQDRLETDDPLVAARAYLVHIGGYIEGPDGGWLKDTTYKGLDPRWKYLGADQFGKVANVEDLGGGLWASAATPKSQYTAGVLKYMKLCGWQGDHPQPAPKPQPAGKLVFGRVPFPGYVDRQFVTANKPAGVGWDDISAINGNETKRSPMFVVLHRMLGTLSGTDGFFANAGTKALTDFGIGTANIDGTDLDGYIYQWNDPRGRRVPWASGPVNSPYGDGLAWLNWKGNVWGPSICNACGVSIEISGQYGDPVSDFAFGELAKFLAYWFDQFGIAYDKAPIHPKTGISAVTWHQEWCIGTGKICPGPWVMDNTQRLIDAASAIMKDYQTQAKG